MVKCLSGQSLDGVGEQLALVCRSASLLSGLTFQAPLVSVGGRAVGGHRAWPWVKVRLLGQAFAGGKEVTQVGEMGRNGHRP